LQTILNLDTARFFDEAGKRVASDAENLLLLPRRAYRPSTCASLERSSAF
jgi:hypothetical protein